MRIQCVFQARAGDEATRLHAHRDAVPSLFTV